MKKRLPSIKVLHEKHTSTQSTVEMPTPKEVSISMSQHIGAPCTPLVKKGDYVKIGQPIGDSQAFVSAPIHASVSGTVKQISSIRSIMGGEDQVVVIESSENQEVWEDVKPPVITDHESFVAAVRNSGVVGLGGAAFPTHIKYNPQNLDEVETLIVNAAECEPFITSDHRTMLENTDDIIEGCKLIIKYLGIKKCYIGIEENKPDAISLLEETIKKDSLDSIEVFRLQSRYPKGAERVMIYEVTGKRMDAGVLPAQLGVILSNINTVAFIGQYARDGMPLIKKRITVDGDVVKEPKNIIAPIGTHISDIIEFCGGYKEEPKKILMGGPMMGRAIFSDELPLVKNNNAILAFSGKQSLIKEETSCINCGACYKACPFNLLPTAIAKSYEGKDAESLVRYKVDQCMECGSCAYVCPARRPLNLLNKLGKAYVKEEASKNG